MQLGGWQAGDFVADAQELRQVLWPVVVRHVQSAAVRAEQQRDVAALGQPPEDRTVDGLGVRVATGRIAWRVGGRGQRCSSGWLAGVGARAARRGPSVARLACWQAYRCATGGRNLPALGAPGRSRPHRTTTPSATD